MWILESDADFLQGKRMWLKPGKQYLFGRVKREGVRFAIDHKTISRKHFVISVGDVKPGDVSKVHNRSKIVITDEKSKQGTFVDGELLKDDTRELTKPEHSIRPGAFHHELRIRWRPCVLTFSITKKEIKADILKPKRERLEELDIKVIVEYINDLTTHVVAGKRNTAKGLQALIQGKRIVADSYVDALVYAATPAELGEEENLSPLEQDFDSAWPKEEPHIPPAGKEPTIRSVKSYSPDPNRRNVFEGFTFIFGDAIQYENLLPAITTGQGKALLYKINNGGTKADELVQYMRNVAGHKGFGDPGKEDENGGVILVRWNRKDEFLEWTHILIDEVSLKLDQRSIDQAEFLDAILANDAFTLRQTIPYESTVDGRLAPPPTAASFTTIRQTPGTPIRESHTASGNANINVPASLPVASSGTTVVPPSLVSADSTRGTQRIHSSAPEPTSKTTVTRTNGDLNPTAQPPKRARLLGAPIPTFDDFDDGFNADSIPSYTGQDYPESFPADSQSPYPSQSLSNGHSRDHSQVTSAGVKDEPQSTRKRRRSPSAVVQHASSDEELDELLPAATAMKRRKLALEAEARARGQPGYSTGNSLAPAPTAVKRKKKKVEKELDVREVLRVERKAEEEAARRDREDLAEGLGYENDEGKPAGLAVVVEMKLPVRERNRTTENDENSTRWDPKWNGRKNFKKFKKVWPGVVDDTANATDAQGRKGLRRGNASKVIVPLVEMKKNTYGFGEKYWDKPRDEVNTSTGRRKGTKISQVQTQSQSQQRNNTRPATQRRGETQTVVGTSESVPIGIDGDDKDDEAHDSSSRAGHPSPEMTRLQAEAAAIVEHAINPDTPRRTRLADKTQSQNASARTGAKRPAASTGRSSAPKKQKTIAVQKVHGSDDSGDDSDDLKFRFRRAVKKG